MIPALRRQYNDSFTNEAYRAMLDYLGGQYGERPTFSVAETPIFIPTEVRDRVLRACDDVLDTILQPDFVARSMAAIPPGENVPNQNAHPHFLQFDFGLCQGPDGEITPQLIEAQGFPSLYFFQYLLDECYRRFFPVPESFTARFGGLSRREYLDLLRRVIIGEHDPKNVILLEVMPDTQNTHIDFTIAARELGIEVVCISDLILKDGQLWYHYKAGGPLTRIERIFNRVIFDELNAHPELLRQFNMVELADVSWAGHPNWFFLVSKYTMPFIRSPFVPETRFLSEYDGWPTDLENYVLKPLYSFAGAGVDLHPTAETLNAIREPDHFILQRRVSYADLIETPDGPARAELRMMYVWPDGQDRPQLVNNLVRLSKGEMIGVKYNKGKTWVGGSLGYFAP